MFQAGQTVRVIDSECKLHRQQVTLVGKNPRNTAEWEVRARDGKVWIVHTVRLRAVITRWQPFSVEELQVLADLLNDQYGHQPMLEEIIAEINQRLGVA